MASSKAKDSDDMPASDNDTISPKSSAESSRDDEDESCSIATQVFAVPELLEMILEHVDVRDVLDAYRINRSTREIIEASPKLQTKLFLRPANAEGMNLLRLKEECNAEGWNPLQLKEDCLPGLWLHQCASTGTVTAAFEGPRLPLIGARCLKMFFCEPPIKKMIMHCDCLPRDDGCFKRVVLESFSGLTCHEDTVKSVTGHGHQVGHYYPTFKDRE
ncbi:hypothetical protein LTR37_021280 [Vermiconidia calcicola]|uniref:Uncharacterized protein n=1 Tax=Vermiconidia calcicola TaxID=1690605 RepID=A0ACC3M934_9PEZI|nr:hypothetical protein LTR37_021280 [Vermiconidia calcicola]